MTDRHLSERFDRGTRECKLLRYFEDNFRGDTFHSMALIDINTQHEMLFVCSRDEMTDHNWILFVRTHDPNDFEDEIFSYDSYDEAVQRFELWSNEPLEPNWEMQAEYDELHGTINGEDAGIVAMRELWGE